MSTKLRNLSEVTVVDEADILYMVVDPSGTPLDKKVTLATLYEKIPGNPTGFVLGGGDLVNRTLTVKGVSVIDQDVSQTGTVTFQSLTATQNAVVYNDLYVGDSIGQESIWIDGGIGYYKGITMISEGEYRWRLASDASSEPGSNVGSDFVIEAFDDTSGDLGVYLKIIRSTGDMTLTGNVTVSGELTSSGGTKGLVTNGNSHDHVGGDGATIGAGGLADGAVNTTAKLANDIVDDTKVGNRVPQFYRRQGGSTLDWHVQGTTTYTPTTVRMQGGTIRWSGSSADNGQVTVTLPVTYSNGFLPFAVSNRVQAGEADIIVACNVQADNQFIIAWKSISATTYTTNDFHWQTIGPE